MGILNGSGAIGKEKCRQATDSDSFKFDSGISSRNSRNMSLGERRTTCHGYGWKEANNGAISSNRQISHLNGPGQPPLLFFGTSSFILPHLSGHWKAMGKRGKGRGSGYFPMMMTGNRPSPNPGIHGVSPPAQSVNNASISIFSCSSKQNSPFKSNPPSWPSDYSFRSTSPPPSALSAFSRFPKIPSIYSPSIPSPPHCHCHTSINPLPRFISRMPKE